VTAPITAVPHHDLLEGTTPVVLTVTHNQPGAIPEAVLALYATLKQDEKADGSWSGGDTIQTVCAWFERLGLDPEPSVHACQVCGVKFLPGDEDDDAANRLGAHLLAEHVREVWS